MSEAERSLVAALNRLPMQSKKFIAFQISNLGWLLLIGLAIWHDEVFAVQMTMVIVAGFIQATYIGGQAIVDIYANKVVPALMQAKNMDALLPKETVSAVEETRPQRRLTFEHSKPETEETP